MESEGRYRREPRERDFRSSAGGERGLGTTDTVVSEPDWECPQVPAPGAAAGSCVGGTAREGVGVLRAGQWHRNRAAAPGAYLRDIPAPPRGVGIPGHGARPRDLQEDRGASRRPPVGDFGTRRRIGFLFLHSGSGPMKAETRTRPVELLLVEDNPGDVRLTIEALKEGKVINNLTVVKDGQEAIVRPFQATEGGLQWFGTKDLEGAGNRGAEVVQRKANRLLRIGEHGTQAVDLLSQIELPLSRG